MRAAPSILTFNPGNAAPAANDHWRRRSSAVDNLAAVQDISEGSCLIRIDDNADDRKHYVIHATADARFF